MRRTFNKHYTKAEAIALHAEANKSDPFASRRMALVLSKGHDQAKAVGEDAQRAISTRRAMSRITSSVFDVLLPMRNRMVRREQDKAARKSRYRQKIAA